MKKNINIEKLSHRTPFNVPNNYFADLKLEMQNNCKKNKDGLFIFFIFFKISNLVPTFATLSILIALFWNNLDFDIKDDYFLDNEEVYALVLEFELENIDEEYLYEIINEQVNYNNQDIEYLMNIDTDYDLIINEL